MRPGLDEDCDYPHPPPRFKEENPLTSSKSLWDAVVMGVIVGAVMGGSPGLFLGYCLGLLGRPFAPGLPVDMVVTVLLSGLAGALAGGMTVGMMLGVGFAVINFLEVVIDLITQPFHGKVDPDADVTDGP